MEWKPLDTNPMYEISDTGLVRSVHMIAQKTDKGGYQRVKIRVTPGKETYIGVHKLVAHVFKPQPNEDELEVHHIDDNPSNNNVDNLMWVTHQQNIDAIDKSTKKYNKGNIRPVAQYTLEGELVGMYPSRGEAGRQTGCNCKHISSVCSGARKTTGGYIWRDVDYETYLKFSEEKQTQKSSSTINEESIEYDYFDNDDII